MALIEIFAWALFAAAQLADVITTKRLLSQGGRELNPVVAFFMSKMGKAWWVAKGGIALIAAGLMHWAGYPLGILALAVLTGAVAANNYRQID
jgi:hypothetical protein